MTRVQGDVVLCRSYVHLLATRQQAAVSMEEARLSQKQQAAAPARPPGVVGRQRF
jgi:hypothetical protein